MKTSLASQLRFAISRLRQNSGLMLLMRMALFSSEEPGQTVLDRGTFLFISARALA